MIYASLGSSGALEPLPGAFVSTLPALSPPRAGLPSPEPLGEPATLCSLQSHPEKVPAATPIPSCLSEKRASAGDLGKADASCRRPYPRQPHNSSSVTT